MVEGMLLLGGMKSAGWKIMCDDYLLRKKIIWIKTSSKK